jgi:DNA gyrase subunit A
VLPSDEVMLISDQGTLLRTVVEQISLLSRNTQGVKVMNVRDGEMLVGMARIAEAEGPAAAGEDEDGGSAAEPAEGGGAADPADG